MACNAEYMRPSDVEVNSKTVCQLLVFLSDKINRDIPEWVHKAANDMYGTPKRLDEATQMLCAMCQDADEAVIYDARDPMCRKLADWWEEHQAADRQREKAEREARVRRLNDLAADLDDFTESELASVGLKRMARE